MNYDLSRFIDAHQREYDQALKEIRNGKKQTHWMWFIFPQIKGLGLSQTSQYYAIDDLDEAISFLYHPYLGQNLREITQNLLLHNDITIHSILGAPDDMKLKSSMTLFSLIDESDENIFKKVIEKYFNNEFDQKTINIICT